MTCIILNQVSLCILYEYIIYIYIGFGGQMTYIINQVSLCILYGHNAAICYRVKPCFFGITHFTRKTTKQKGI